MRSRPTTRVPPQTSDEDLWAAAQQGDEAAFGHFYRRHRLLALRIAGRICGGEAEDAVQAAFLSTWRNRGSFSPAKGSARNWMLAAVRNRAIDTLRKTERRRDNPTREGLDEVEDPVRTEEAAVERETARELRAAIAELPIRQRQVLALGYFAGLSQSEIASTLGLPLGTVKGRSRAALQGLATVAT